MIGITKEREMKPKNWSTELIVWDDGTEWDGMAVDPDDNPEAYLQAFLDDTADDSCTGQDLRDADCWARVEWDDDMQKYHCDRIEDSRGNAYKYERTYDPDDLSYLPDMYKVD
jgi:hypothetical protein